MAEQEKSEFINSGLAGVPTQGASTAESSDDPTLINAEAERKTTLSDEELAYFRKLILERRAIAIEDIDRMKAQLEDAREQQESDSAYSFHMADAGTDAMEREKLYLMVARQQKYVGYLDRALDRIRNRTYGICKVTGKPISKERLEAVPHTEVSIEAKLKQKK